MGPRRRLPAAAALLVMAVAAGLSIAAATVASASHLSPPSPADSRTVASSTLRDQPDLSSADTARAGGPRRLRACREGEAGLDLTERAAGRALAAGDPDREQNDDIFIESPPDSPPTLAPPPSPSSPSSFSSTLIDYLGLRRECLRRLSPLILMQYALGSVCLALLLQGLWAELGERCRRGAGKGKGEEDGEEEEEEEEEDPSTPSSPSARRCSASEMNILCSVDCDAERVLPLMGASQPQIRCGGGGGGGGGR
jgi:hypothetical protein